ncbi:class I SAM-dependent methyltransferase [Guptibacillus hwajinpoensis]|uniref:Ubiquinone/menaquinone biosynthesis C-methylase UbiE n=1 Tax=Guptibacillus hwajinpoensis TaxID=208199 RepID=A0ABU0K6P7_9BACL|nr:class I SAM-dependent methyltransferase [Alkalihalobacillus hemicentroti]MDQ0483792.1 ubiquinone/menaquinone biosynthesis C-methylase UbiE [Alkalihalobacillus hemicentroti]
MLKRLRRSIGTQYQKPVGLLGLYVGERMIREHRPDTLWTLRLLKLSNNERLLELGCGSGYALKLLLEHSGVTEAVGIDISEDILKSAAIRNWKGRTKGRVRLEQGDVKNLPFENDYFTKVYSIHSVYFWDDYQKTIEEVYRVLKPKGTLLITLCNGRNGESKSEIQKLITHNLVPNMLRTGFQNIKCIKGEVNSQQYQTVTIFAEK